MRIHYSLFVPLGEDHFQVLDLTRNLTAFKTFLAGISAKGGDDFPEDVGGGINRAVALPWPQNGATRILFHLGDAPPHGKGKYHSCKDDYPSGHPRDKPLEQLFREMHKKGIMYYFGRINSDCDKMIHIFQSPRNYGKKNRQLRICKRLDHLQLRYGQCDQVGKSHLHCIRFILAKSLTKQSILSARSRAELEDAANPVW